MRSYQKRQEWKAWLAFGVGFVLFIQSFFGALAVAATADPLQRDAFGNIICSVQNDAALQDGSPAHQQKSVFDCCQWGCSMASPLLAAQDYIAVPQPRPVMVAAPVYFYVGYIALGFEDGRPGAPRGPPVLYV